jgi:hypothetical protein
MVEIPLLDPSEAPRARRWDALILGSGISAMVAAARIGAVGQRVLVVEEESRAKLPPAMKEPFFLAGLRDEGVLDACLRALTVPLIDRRRIEAERLAYQIAADPYRLDIGRPALTADELVTWGLAKPDEAHTLIRRLLEASEIERKLLLEATFVRIGRRNPAARSGPGFGNHKRGLPGDAASASGELGHVIAAQIRTLSNLGQHLPSPEAQARLLGLGLAGGAGFSDEPPWLLDLLRKRVTARYGDIRTLSGRLELVSVSGQPGIRVPRTGEIWLGRRLVLAAPLTSLREAYGDAAASPPPSLLERRTTRGYRAALLYRVPVALLPEGMGARLILPGGGEPSNPTLTVTAFPCHTHSDQVDLVVRALLDESEKIDRRTATADLQDHVEERLRALMPFTGKGLQRVAVETPQWDSEDGWLEDPKPGSGWPGEIDLRLSGRPPVYHLNRAAVAGLGLEGDLLLGWRGGDAIAAELA